MSRLRALETVLAAASTSTPNDAEAIDVLEACAKECAQTSFREDMAASTIDDHVLALFLKVHWTALQALDGTPASTSRDGVTEANASIDDDDDDDDGISYSYTTTSSSSIGTDLPANSTFLRDPDTAIQHVNVLLSAFRFLRNACVSMPATQSKLQSLLPLTLSMLTRMVGYLDCSHEPLHASIVLCMQVMLQFTGNMTVNHPSNQEVVWGLIHPALLEKLLVECQKHRKILAYAAAVVLNCLHPEHAGRTMELVASRQIIILLLQRCLSFRSDDDADADPAFEWISILFRVLVERQHTPDLYRNLSASLLSSLWSKLTPEQMLLLRMVDMVVASSTTPATDGPTQHAPLVEFICTEFTALHAAPTAPRDEESGEDEPSTDRQAMWDVMEVESSKLMLHILGTLTSTDLPPTLHEHAAVVTFIPVLVGQLRRFATTHSRETNAAALSTEPVVEDETYGYRSAGVRVLGNLAHRNTAVQDALRACGGLEVLLNSCNIDPKNPMIREWALVALRHVCEGNEPNQAYIRALSPQEVVPRVDLTKMGVEPVLENNKMTLKPV